MTAFYPDDDAIARLAHGLLDHSLPKAAWTHAAHFAATLWLLRHRSDLVLEDEMPAIIRTYNASVGGENTDTAGFHATITRASIGQARDFLARRPPSEPLHEAVDLLMATPLGRPDWLMAYWSRDLLFSIPARQGWVVPDIQPLP